MKFRREAGQGGIVPRGWGMAWYEPCCRIGIYYPIPLNWIMRVWREFAYRLRLALNAPPIECAQMFEMQRTHHERCRLADEYANGYMAGWHECYQECLTAVESEITRVDEVWDIPGLLAEAANPARPKN